MSTRQFYQTDYIIKMYNNGLSPYEIAENLGNGWNHMRVRRVISKLGIPLRDKSEAQKNALRSGRALHPKKSESYPTSPII